MKVARLGARPVFIADYSSGTQERKGTAMRSEAGAVREASSSPSISKTGLRTKFPEAGGEYEGGHSDGHCYRITFSGGRFETSFSLLRDFLIEEGYQDLPLPQNARELLRFRLPPKLQHQLSIFGDNGYVHNPIKILFPVIPGRRGELILEVYNQGAVDHLLRFHRR